MRTLPRLLVSASLGLAWLTVPSSQLHAQALRTVGGFAGRTDSWQKWPGFPEAGHKHGFEVGAFAETPAPPSWLSILTEVAYTQRGARLPLSMSGAGPPIPGDVRVDYIAAAVLPTVRISFGPVSLFGYGGPGVAVNVRTRTAPELSLAYQNYRAEVLTAQAGGGVALQIADRWSVRLELRRSADVTAAYTDAPGDIRFRAQEILLRVGVRPRLPLP